ncbi:hypothetical protein [Micromonospora psammae]|uniref:hypothetical protein n=1 Tax=Micromonospora sp. CPCC 205556 TaxID=3122398 RepID=UPI002FEF1387
MVVVLAELLPSRIMSGPLESVGLTKPPPGYVSLAIVEHRTVPEKAVVGEVLTLRVRLHSREGARITYPIVSAVTDGAGRPLSQGSTREVVLGPDEVRDVEVTLPTPACTGRVQATVSLSGRTETVRVWIVLTSNSREVGTCA